MATIHLFVKILFFSLVSFSAFAFTDSEIETKLQEVVTSRHPDQSEEWFRNLGANAPKVIIRMYEKNSNIMQRMRLVDSLKAFRDDPVVIEFYRQELQKNSQTAERRNLARNISLHLGVAALNDLQPLLEDKDPEMRLQVAQSIRKIQSPQGQEALAAYRKTEKESWIVKKIDSEPAELKPLSIVSTSEDSGPLKFRGEWQGFLIFPKTTDLQTVPATLLAVEKNGKLTDLILSWKNAGKIKKLTLNPAKLTSNSIKGDVAGFEKNLTTLFQAQLFEGKMETQIQIQLPEKGFTFLGTKSSKSVR